MASRESGSKSGDTDLTTLQLRLPFKDQDGFVEGFSRSVKGNLVTIKTRKEKEAGARFLLDLRLADGQSMLRAKARVTRAVKAKTQGFLVELQLDDLDENSAEMLRRLNRTEPKQALAPKPEPAKPKGTPPPPPSEAFDDARKASQEENDRAPCGDEKQTQTPRSENESDAVEEDDDLDLELDVAPPGPELVFLEPPSSVPDEGPIIGIDLGTTNSCVAMVQGNKPVIIRSREGYNTIPSVISVSSKNKLMVGHPARSQMLTNPEQTVYGAKRLVGRMFESDTVQLVSNRFHYPICSDSKGNAAVQLGEKVVSLEEVQALVLAECKEVAQNVLGQRVHRAVVTVPAYYSDSQRQAVRESARLAGLKLERILNEPTAAALAYGLDRNLEKRVLVYDLGGGTFDATAMSIEGNVFEVLATGGDTFLGGVDFDNQVVDWLLERFAETNGRQFEGDHVALSRVSAAAEAAKVALSEAQTHEVFVPFLSMDETGRPMDLKCTISRDDLIELTQELVDRSIDVVRDVILDADLKPSDVDDVILVGGQSRMPLVRQKITEMFGRDPHPGVHPDEAVALGAAMLAGSLGDIGSIVLIDVLPMTIGVGLPGGRFKRVIERNTPLPASKAYAISTPYRKGRKVEVAVFQGEDTNVSANEYLGTLRLPVPRRHRKSSINLEVSFDLGPECVLEVSARDMDTGKMVRSSFATSDTPDALRKRLDMEAPSVSKDGSERAEELSKRGGGFWSRLKRAVGG